MDDRARLIILAIMAALFVLDGFVIGTGYTHFFGTPSACVVTQQVPK